VRDDEEEGRGVIVLRMCVVNCMHSTVCFRAGQGTYWERGVYYILKKGEGLKKQMEVSPTSTKTDTPLDKDTWEACTEGGAAVWLDRAK